MTFTEFKDWTNWLGLAEATSLAKRKGIKLAQVQLWSFTLLGTTSCKA